MVLWAVVGAFVTGMGARDKLIDWSGQIVTTRTEIDDEVADGIAEWNFASQLYRQLPADINFLARGIRIDKTTGARTTLHSPDGTSFTVLVSELIPADNSN